MESKNEEGRPVTGQAGEALECVGVWVSVRAYV